jgi:hypothetical protein
MVRHNAKIADAIMIDRFSIMISFKKYGWGYLTMLIGRLKTQVLGNSLVRKNLPFSGQFNT